MSLKISLNPSRAAVFYQAERPFVPSNYPKPRVAVADNTVQPKKLSDKAQKRIKHAINWMCYLSKKRNVRRSGGRFLSDFQISFVTLTLPSKQKHSHSVIKSKCLNRFLTVARAKWGIENYVWKAELQKNGNIHFHLTTDKYIPYMAIRREWNAAIAKLGYITEYADKFKNMSFEEYHAFRSSRGSSDRKKNKRGFDYGNASNWAQPNTTDVHSVKNIKNLAAYMAKYLTKELTHENSTAAEIESAESYKGRLWYCSQSLSKLGNVVLNFNPLTSRIIRSLKSIKSVFSFANEWVECFFFKASQLPRQLKEALRQQLVSHALVKNYPFPSDIPTFA